MRHSKVVHWEELGFCRLYNIACSEGDIFIASIYSEEGKKNPNNLLHSISSLGPCPGKDPVNVIFVILVSSKQAEVPVYKQNSSPQLITLKSKVKSIPQGMQEKKKNSPELKSVLHNLYQMNISSDKEKKMTDSNLYWVLLCSHMC